MKRIMIVDKKRLGYYNYCYNLDKKRKNMSSKPYKL